MLIAHLSDLHLGRASPGDPHGAQRLDSFRNTLATLARMNPDTLIISGDTFDGPHVDVPIVEDAAKSLSKLKNERGEPISVVLIPGNHDPSEADKLWTAFRKHLSASVKLVHKPDIVELADGKLVVEAYPCATRYSAVPPWEKRIDVPAFDDTVVHVVVAHGTLIGGPVPDEDTDAYPFTQADVEALGAHYVALGHFHGLYPPWGDSDECERSFCYAGTHEPIQYDRDSGYVVLAHLSPKQPARLRRLKVGRRHWKQLLLTGPADLVQVEHLLAEIEASEDRSRYVVRLKISSRHSWPSADIARLARLEEAMRALGAQIECRGDAQACVDVESFDWNELPSGAIREALLSLRNERQSCGDENRRELLVAALQLGWQKVREAMHA
jgi:DNA repair exonuclease SbcCD nuclease subunit